MMHECGFWGCSNPREKGRFWCCGHSIDFRRGLVNFCPGCGWGKDIRFPTCPGCRSDSRVLPAGHSPPVWGFAHREFYVYVLQLDDGAFFAGYSRNIWMRLREHRDGMVHPTSGRSPELVWFSMAESREAAESLKTRVRQLCLDNPWEMRRWILEFRDLMGGLESL